MASGGQIIECNNDAAGAAVAAQSGQTIKPAPAIGKLLYNNSPNTLLHLHKKAMHSIQDSV